MVFKFKKVVFDKAGWIKFISIVVLEGKLSNCRCLKSKQKKPPKAEGSLHEQIYASKLYCRQLPYMQDKEKKSVFVEWGDLGQYKFLLKRFKVLASHLTQLAISSSMIISVFRTTAVVIPLFSALVSLRPSVSCFQCGALYFKRANQGGTWTRNYPGIVEKLLGRKESKLISQLQGQK